MKWKLYQLGCLYNVKSAEPALQAALGNYPDRFFLHNDSNFCLYLSA
jgi:hypothetical protein